MNTREHIDRSTTYKKISLALVCALIWAFQFIAFADHHHDDAFITFRYGANLATGKGLVFNEGERIMGSTSPGQCLISAVVYLAAGKTALPNIMIALGCLAWTACALAFFLILRKPLGDVGAAFPALCTAVGVAGSHGWIALETNTVVACVLFAVVSFMSARWKTMAVLLAAAVLMRPDALLPAVVLAVPCAIALRTRFIVPAAIFTGIVLPWIIFAAVYYGSPIPQSAVTKFHNADILKYGLHLLTVPAKSPVAFVGTGAFSTIIVWGMSVLGAVLLIKQDRRMWVIPAYGLLHISAYLYLRPFTQHTWHLFPETLLLSVLFLTPIAALYQMKRNVPAVRILLLVVMSIMVLGYGKRTSDDATSYNRAYWGGARNRAYEAVVKYIDAHAAPGDGIAAGEVGTIGYHSERRMFDLGGLTTKTLVLNLLEYRWIVVDGKTLAAAPSSAELQTVISSGDFAAYIFYFDGR